jgi:hypothetical protein
MARISIAGWQNPKDVSRETTDFASSEKRSFLRETADAAKRPLELFHVKQELTIFLNQLSIG